MRARHLFAAGFLAVAVLAFVWRGAALAGFAILLGWLLMLGLMRSSKARDEREQAAFRSWQQRQEQGVDGFK